MKQIFLSFLVVGSLTAPAFAQDSIYKSKEAFDQHLSKLVMTDVYLNRAIISSIKVETTQQTFLTAKDANINQKNAPQFISPVVKVDVITKDKVQHSFQAELMLYLSAEKSLVFAGTFNIRFKNLSNTNQKIAAFFKPEFCSENLMTGVNGSVFDKKLEAKGDSAYVAREAQEKEKTCTKPYQLKQ